MAWKGLEKGSIEGIEFESTRGFTRLKRVASAYDGERAELINQTRAQLAIFVAATVPLRRTLICPLAGTPDRVRWTRPRDITAPPIEQQNAVHHRDRGPPRALATPPHLAVALVS